MLRGWTGGQRPRVRGPCCIGNGPCLRWSAKTGKSAVGAARGRGAWSIPPASNLLGPGRGGSGGGGRGRAARGGTPQGTALIRRALAFTPAPVPLPVQAGNRPGSSARWRRRAGGFTQRVLVGAWTWWTRRMPQISRLQELLFIQIPLKKAGECARRGKGGGGVSTGFGWQGSSYGWCWCWFASYYAMLMVVDKGRAVHLGVP